MAKITVEIEDNLADLVATMKEAVQEDFSNFQSENPDMLPSDWEAGDFMFEKADGLVPVWDNEIKGPVVYPR